MIRQLLFSLLLCTSTFAQRPLGTFILGSPTTNACPTGASCRNFTVTIPNFPYPLAGELAVRSPNGQIKAVDVFFSGSTGTDWWGVQVSPGPSIEQFFQSLLSTGHQVIQVKWNAAWLASPQGVQLGQVALACRPATVIQWIHDHYPAPRFNLIGTSAGGAALAYALAQYGISTDKVVIDSGPPFMELRKACEHYPGYEFGPEKPVVDMAYGFQSNGPCVRVDRSFESQWDANSVESGGTFFYPATAVHVIIGLSDGAYIQNRGRDYYNLLISNGQNVRYYRIPQMTHGVQRSQLGLNTLLGILTQLSVS